jgi:branched-chain amino acid transport system permease protein
MIEMVYHLQLNSAGGSDLRFVGVPLDTRSVNSWFGAAFVLFTGVAMFELTRRGFLRHWGEIQEFIEKETKRREALA